MATYTEAERTSIKDRPRNLVHIPERDKEKAISGIKHWVDAKEKARASNKEEEITNRLPFLCVKFRRLVKKGKRVLDVTQEVWEGRQRNH